MRLLGRARSASSRSARGRGARCARGARRPASCPSTSAWTPARPSSSPTRRTCTRPTRASARRRPTDRRKVMILGSGPNRIGQGIEFDYCCCHGAFAFKEEGFETIMVNCNPETVSTDYDTSDRLYFEPLTFEDVMNVDRAGEARGRRRSSSAGRRRCGWRCRCSAPASRSWARAPTRSTWPRTASASARCSRELGIPQPESGTATLARRGQGGRGAHRLPGAGAAVLRAGRARHGDRLRRAARSRSTCARPSRPRPSTRS